MEKIKFKNIDIEYELPKEKIKKEEKKTRVAVLLLKSASGALLLFMLCVLIALVLGKNYIYFNYFITALPFMGLFLFIAGLFSLVGIKDYTDLESQALKIHEELKEITEAELFYVLDMFVVKYSTNKGNGVIDLEDFLSLFSFDGEIINNVKDLTKPFKLDIKPIKNEYVAIIKNI